MRLLVRRIFYYKKEKAMKKVAQLTILAIVLSTLFFSCRTEENADFYLVKQTYTDKSGTTTVSYLYNEEYKIIKQVTDTGKDSSTVSEYEYDENGYQNYQKIVANSGLIQELFTKNDSEGRAIENKLITNYNGNITEATTTIEYIDENGSYIQTSSQGVVITFTFDDYGNYLSIVSSGAAEQTITYENKYEGGFLMNARITTVTKNKTVVQTAKYAYDKQGNKVKSEIFDENGNVTVTETFEYSNTPEIIK